MSTDHPIGSGWVCNKCGWGKATTIRQFISGERDQRPACEQPNCEIYRAILIEVHPTLDEVERGS